MSEKTGTKWPQFARLRHWLLALPRYTKRATLVTADLLVLSAVLCAALSLRYGVLFIPPGVTAFVLTLAGPVLTVGTLWYFGLYKRVTRFIGHRGNTQILAAVGLSVLIWALALFMLGQYGIPRSVIITYAAGGAAAILASRALIKLLLESSGLTLTDIEPKNRRTATLIYGAGEQGIALLRAIRLARDRHVLGFIDSSPDL